MPAGPAANTICGYCTNVHPGATLAEVEQQLDQHAVAVRDLLGDEAPLPVGLWFAADVAEELAAPGATESLGAWLGERKLRPYTLNGFPYANFHQPVVKHAVYEPDWTTPQRLAYTLRLAELLAALIDEGEEGSISTLPIGWPRGGEEDERRCDAAGARLRQLADQLAKLEARTGRWIHVSLEPEPGCLLDTADDVVRFFEEHLLRGAADESVIRRYLGVCHDVCHSAVMFEPQAQAISRYRAAGIRIGKVQVSSAVSAPFDQMAPDQASEALQQLRQFSEPRYLHQTTVRQADGTVRLFDDLGDALAAAGDNPPRQPWRVHFHVPIHIGRFEHLVTTQPDIGECLAALGEDTCHFEVETYAWSVLPRALQTADLADGIAQELRWLREQSAGDRP
jgi:hypothetical protein